MRSVFVSYSHSQGQWVWDCLLPCLETGGINVLIDRERFEAGRGIIGQMDTVQDQANVHLLLLSDEYLQSKYCQHEMTRAISKDPTFSKGVVVPVRLDGSRLPASIRSANPLVVDLQRETDAQQWTLLLAQCGVRLGATAPDWLAARAEMVRLLRRKTSVNLVIHGNVEWEGLIRGIQQKHFSDLALVDLEDGRTASRRGFVEEVLRKLHCSSPVPEAPRDLAELSRVISERSLSRVALMRFDLAAYRLREYDVNLFGALRNLVMSKRKLVLLIQSRQPFASLLPERHPLSSMDVRTVELRGAT